jgi:hypothetical protein
MTIGITGALLTEVVVISSSTRTTVYTAKGRTLVASIIVTPTTGTPTLTISRYDGTTRVNLRTAVAMTAGTAFVFETPFMLDVGGLLEVTSSSANGDMHVLTTIVNPEAPAIVRGST